MSFIENLANKQNKGRVHTPESESIPISLPEAREEGLASSYREPYRINGPLGSPVSPTTRSRMSVLPPPPQQYRG